MESLQVVGRQHRWTEHVVAFEHRVEVCCCCCNCCFNCQKDSKTTQRCAETHTCASLTRATKRLTTLVTKEVSVDSVVGLHRSIRHNLDCNFLGICTHTVDTFPILLVIAV